MICWRLRCEGRRLWPSADVRGCASVTVGAAVIVVGCSVEVLWLWLWSWWYGGASVEAGAGIVAGCSAEVCPWARGQCCCGCRLARCHAPCPTRRLLALVVTGGASGDELAAAGACSVLARLLLHAPHAFTALLASAELPPPVLQVRARSAPARAPALGGQALFQRELRFCSSEGSGFGGPGFLPARAPFLFQRELRSRGLRLSSSESSIFVPAIALHFGGADSLSARTRCCPVVVTVKAPASMC